MTKNILDLSALEAKEFFLKNESYSNLARPEYIDFTGLLTEINKLMIGKSYTNVQDSRVKIWTLESVNYKLFHNKDGKYDWRPLELIHPVMYVSLVNKITEVSNWQLIKDRIRDIETNSFIKNIGMPVIAEKNQQKHQILEWCEKIEQNSLKLALDFKYLYNTDITNCYSSIYTHSIAWAIHTKDIAKSNQNDMNLIGNQIDKHIQHMSYGQTNGIPQGSILMDYIAEIVLYYADEEISKIIREKGISKELFEILRYRDDYRVFVNEVEIGEKLIKIISEILADLGLKLNPSKTKYSSNVIRDSVKKGKLNYLKSGFSFNEEKNLQRRLLFIHEFANENQNEGELIKMLENSLEGINKIRKQDVEVLISIVTDIGFRNTRTYPQVAAILSKLFNEISDMEREEIVNKVIKKLEKLPNTGCFDIWLQRAIYKWDSNRDFKEKICKIVKGETPVLWDSSWIGGKKILKAISDNSIINAKKLEEISGIIEMEELSVFKHRYS